MPELKLAKLPNRTPIKLTITILPELHSRLETYAQAYADTYGTPEPITDLLPAMLAHFLDSDREFVRVERKPASDRS